MSVFKTKLKYLGAYFKCLCFWSVISIILLTELNVIGVKSKQTLAQTNQKTIPVTNSWRSASFPVENFQAYTSPFGYRIHPVSGDKQFHYGLDIAAPLGSYVRNWWGGTVVSLSDNTGCGTMIQIKSGSWTHKYCHLMGSVQNTPQGRVLVDNSGGIYLWEGQQVPAGARIARVGMTGNTTGPHLHWELTYNGQHIDPATVLRQMFAQQI
jgi:murein DD-endopeptidase MepM/ murein hydrolase activator NlpD